MQGTVILDSILHFSVKNEMLFGSLSLNVLRNCHDLRFVYTFCDNVRKLLTRLEYYYVWPCMTLFLYPVSE